MYLPDTNVCIRFLNGRSATISQRMAAVRPSQVKLCSVVKAEMLYGAARSTDPERSRATLEGFFSHYESLPFDDLAASEYGRIRAHLSGLGTPIGPNDLMIAAIAVSRGLVLVTHNTREFLRVPGLALEDWEA